VGLQSHIISFTYVSCTGRRLRVGAFTRSLQCQWQDRAALRQLSATHIGPAFKAAVTVLTGIHVRFFRGLGAGCAFKFKVDGTLGTPIHHSLTPPLTQHGRIQIQHDRRNRRGSLPSPTYFYLITTQADTLILSSHRTGIQNPAGDLPRWDHTSFLMAQAPTEPGHSHAP
jgi:hypothetical protein